MLQQIRDKITGWFASLFLGAIAVVFIFWGIRFESAATSAAAKVNGESIPVEQVRRAWQERQNELQQAIRDQLPPELIKAEQQKLVDGFVRREVLLQHVEKMGYRVSDQDMVRQLEQIPALQVDGKFSRDRYAALLRAQGRSEVEFEHEFRRDLQISQLQNGVSVSAFATPGEIRRRIELEGETRDIDYVTLPAAKFAAQATVSPADVTAYYDKNKSRFMTPETVSLQYLQLNLADVAASLPATDEALKQYYDQVAAERFVDPERRRARHILIDSSKDDAAARKKAEDVYKRARAGEDFGKLAEQNSDDPGSKAQGGELGWATREAYVQPFAEALFAMQQGEIRGPVKTQFGYHVIQLEEIQPSHQRSFDEVKADLEKDYRNEQAQSIFYEKSQQLADESFAALSELDSVAKKLGLQVQAVEGFTRQGGGPFGQDRKVIEAVFSDDVLQDRQNSAAINVGEDKVVVVRVTDYKPSVQQPIDAVRPQIEAALRDEGARKAAEAAAKAEAAKLNAGASFAEVTKQLDLQPAGASTVTRVAQGVSPELLKAVFATPRPAPGKAAGGTAVLPTGDVALFVVNAVRAGTIPTTPEAAAQLGQEAQRVARQAAGVEFSAYLAELVRTAKVRLNEKVFE
jgi:peptidyl-prolyl cis-trans isomerase D